MPGDVFDISMRGLFLVNHHRMAAYVIRERNEEILPRVVLQDDDELVMETFYHQSGTVYTCVYQGGQRFYLDSWQTQVTCAILGENEHLKCENSALLFSAC